MSSPWACPLDCQRDALNIYRVYCTTSFGAALASVIRGTLRHIRGLLVTHGTAMVAHRLERQQVPCWECFSWISFARSVGVSNTNFHFLSPPTSWPSNEGCISFPRLTDSSPFVSAPRNQAQLTFINLIAALQDTLDCEAVESARCRHTLYVPGSDIQSFYDIIVISLMSSC